MSGLAVLQYVATLNALAAQQPGYRDSMDMDATVRLLRARLPRMAIIHPDDWEKVMAVAPDTSLDSLL